MAKKLGKATIKWDGNVLDTLPGAKIDIGGNQRTTVVGANEVHGFFETPKQSKVECEISVGRETDLDALRQIENATISFECDTGQAYVIRGAWLTDTPEMTAADGGKVPLTFEGPPADKVG